MRVVLEQALWALAVSVLMGPALPRAYHIAGVPLAEQHRNWCGPVALAAVLQFHGEEVKAADIADVVYRSGNRGSLNLDLLVYARQRGFEVWAERGTPERVKKAVVRDRPVVCMVRERSLLTSSNHYVVVRGYDDDGDIWLMDRSDGKERRVRARDFAREWEGCRNWMLVVEGRGSGQRQAPGVKGQEGQAERTDAAH